MIPSFYSKVIYGTPWSCRSLTFTLYSSHILICYSERYGLLVSLNESHPNLWKYIFKLLLQIATRVNLKQSHSPNSQSIDLRMFKTNEIHFCSLIQPLQWAEEILVLFAKRDYPLKAGRRMLPTEPHLQVQRVLSQFLALIPKLLVLDMSSLISS